MDARCGTHFCVVTAHVLKAFTAGSAYRSPQRIWQPASSSRPLHLFKQTRFSRHFSSARQLGREGEGEGGGDKREGAGRWVAGKCGFL